jgi:serine/threonine protein kinase
VATEKKEKDSAKAPTSDADQDLLTRTRLAKGRSANIHYTKRAAEAIKMLQSEIELHVSLRHPNVVLFMGAVLEEGHVYLMTEFMPIGSLDKLLQNSAFPLSFHMRANILIEMAAGLGES